MNNNIIISGGSNSDDHRRQLLSNVEKQKVNDRRNGMLYVGNPTNLDWNGNSILDRGSTNTNVLGPITTTTTTTRTCPASTVANDPAVYVENLYFRYEVGTINFTDPTIRIALEEAFVQAYNDLVLCSSTPQWEVADGAVLQVEAAYLMFGYDHRLNNRSSYGGAATTPTTKASSSSFQNDFFLMSMDLRCNYCQSVPPDSTTLEECDIVAFDSSSDNNPNEGVGVLDCACLPPTTEAFAERFTYYLPSELSDVVITAISDIVVIPNPVVDNNNNNNNNNDEDGSPPSSTTTPGASTLTSTIPSTQVLVRRAIAGPTSNSTNNNIIINTNTTIIDLGSSFPSLLLKQQRGCIPLGAEGLLQYENEVDGDGGTATTKQQQEQQQNQPAGRG